MGRLALVMLCAADVLVALDGTVVGVALPSIQRSLGFSATGLQWVVTAYTVTLGSFLLLGGRIADAAGPRRTLVCGLAVFTGGSLLAGLARAPTVLVGARAIAGLGAALAIPAALALIADGYRDGHERTRALGFVSAGIDAGMVLGAVVGGVVTAALGWPWAFFLAVPFGAAAVPPPPPRAGRAAPGAPGAHRPARRDHRRRGRGAADPRADGGDAPAARPRHRAARRLRPARAGRARRRPARGRRRRRDRLQRRRFQWRARAEHAHDA